MEESFLGTLVRVFVCACACLFVRARVFVCVCVCEGGGAAAAAPGMRELKGRTISCCLQVTGVHSLLYSILSHFFLS